MKYTTHLSSVSFFASNFSALRVRSRVLLLTAAIMLFVLSAQSTTFAGSAMWRKFAPHENWDTARNWTPQTVPNGPTDTATFDKSKKIAPFLSADTEVNGIVFNAGASPFTIIASSSFSLTLSGAGIT